MNYRELEAQQLIEKVDVNLTRAVEILRKSRKDLFTARSNLSIDEEWSYTIAYHAMLRAGRALMLSEGYRPKGRDQHKTSEIPKGVGFMRRHFVWILAGLMLIAMLGFSSTSFAEAEKGKWTKKADMPTARADLAICVIDGKIYAIGGRAKLQLIYFSTVEEYDRKAQESTGKHRKHRRQNCKGD